MRCCGHFARHACAVQRPRHTSHLSEDDDDGGQVLFALCDAVTAFFFKGVSVILSNPIPYMRRGRILGTCVTSIYRVPIYQKITTLSNSSERTNIRSYLKNVFAI